jgi:hypothetical protein
VENKKKETSTIVSVCIKNPDIQSLLKTMCSSKYGEKSRVLNQAILLGITELAKNSGIVKYDSLECQGNELEKISECIKQVLQPLQSFQKIVALIHVLLEGLNLMILELQKNSRETPF